MIAQPRPLCVANLQDEFNERFYAAAYPDLAEAGLDESQLWTHFATHGYNEHRSINSTTNTREFWEDHYECSPDRCEQSQPHWIPGQARIKTIALLSSSSAQPSCSVALEAGHFDPDFYKSHYGSLPGCNDDPKQHFSEAGLALGLYPNEVLLHRHAAVLQASGMLKKARLDLVGESELADPLNFLLFARLKNVEPNEQFDSAFFRTFYDQTTPGAPVIEYIERTQFQVTSLAKALHEAERVRRSPSFSHQYYKAANRLPDELDPALHYVVIGIPELLPASSEFSSRVYVEQYPDLIRLNPVVHFDQHGIAEGRTPPCPVRTERAVTTPDPGEPSVLVVSHEASRTGAPIVALRLAEEMSSSTNVLTWVGKPGGELASQFEDVSTAYLDGWGVSVSDLERLRSDFNIAYAIVSSVVSGHILDRLQAAQIPSVTLLHEFADYVRPVGTLAGTVVRSDVSVFPAEEVRKSLDGDAFALFGTTIGGEVRVRPQGFVTNNRPAAAPTSEPTSRSAPITVLGAGWVQPRKGVDLFFQTQQALMRLDPTRSWRFLWIGDNYDPDAGGEAMYLDAFMKRSGIGERASIIPAVEDFPSMLTQVDIFFMSSRLDPFPNVALDALQAQKPVVCFKRATGIAELADLVPSVVRSVPYCDVNEAAVALMNLADTSPSELFTTDVVDTLEAKFEFSAYAADIAKFGKQAKAAMTSRLEFAEMLRRELSAPDLEIAVSCLHDWWRKEIGPLNDEASVLALAADHIDLRDVGLERRGSSIKIRGRAVIKPNDASSTELPALLINTDVFDFEHKVLQAMLRLAIRNQISHGAEIGFVGTPPFELDSRNPVSFLDPTSEVGDWSTNFDSEFTTIIQPGSNDDLVLILAYHLAKKGPTFMDTHLLDAVLPVYNGSESGLYRTSRIQDPSIDKAASFARV